MAWRKARSFERLSSSCKGVAKTQLDARGVTTKADLFTTQNSSEDILRSNNGEELCAKMTSKELLKSLLNLQLVAYEPVVDLSMKILTSNSMKSPLFRAAVLPVLKRTAYSHFCAGENVEEASKTLARMWQLGLRGIMTYGLEDATDSESCDKNLEKFLQVVLQTSQLPPDSVRSCMLAFKVIFRLSGSLVWSLCFIFLAAIAYMRCYGLIICLQLFSTGELCLCEDLCHLPHRYPRAREQFVMVAACEQGFQKAVRRTTYSLLRNL
jgi:hypothetical protein